MKAVICAKYGPPEVLQIKEVEKPIPKANEVLIKIHATAVTASDCIIRGFNPPGRSSFPVKQIRGLVLRLAVGITKPKNPIIGLVLSGEIESVGKDIKQFKPGDQVYGMAGFGLGAYAEYKCMKETASSHGCLAIKPENITHEEAAAIAYGGILASHFLRIVEWKNSQKILIYGASGAIGTLAVQLAKCHGAEVTGVCSTKNLNFIQTLGADKVIDHTKEDSLDKLERYGLVFDAVGENKGSALKVRCRKALHPGGKYISVDDGILKYRSEYLVQLNRLIEAGKIRAVVDSRYPLEQIVEAHRYVDQGHKRGNVVVTV